MKTNFKNFYKQYPYAVDMAVVAILMVISYYPV
jgi:hypothetical protein